MATEFDPYKELLDIQPTDGPPDHYALLGLEQFESDRTKIDDAAGERMSLLQEFANSEHLDASQKLLNEVSAARRCLLNETKKIAYDEDLRSRQRRAATSSPGKRNRNQKGPHKFVPLGIAIAVVGGVCLLFVLLRGGPTPSGNLILDWPLSERQGAAVLLDGKELTITDDQPIYLQIPNGRHRVVFRRSGYRDIPKTQVFSDVKVKMKLSWVPQK